MEDLRIAQWLDAMIAADGTKIQKLADHVGVSVSQVSKWKSGEQILKRPEHVFKVAEFYGVDQMRLLATADPTFRERGFEPLPMPEVDGDHLLSRLPRYVGDRERRLMGRIARLGSHAKSIEEESDNPTDKIRDTFSAIDHMLDTIQELITDEGDENGREQRAPGDGGGAARQDRSAGRRGGRAGRGAGGERGGRRGGTQASYWPSLQGALATGW